MIEKELANYIVSKKFDNLSDEEVTKIKFHFLDTIGTIIAGSSAPGISALVKLTEEWGEKKKLIYLAMDMVFLR